MLYRTSDIFQYPISRIVLCHSSWLSGRVAISRFQYPISRIVLCHDTARRWWPSIDEELSVSYLTDRSLSLPRGTPRQRAQCLLSVSYLTDRSLSPQRTGLLTCGLMLLSVSYLTDRSLSLQSAQCLIAGLSKTFSILSHGSFFVTAF